MSVWFEGSEQIQCDLQHVKDSTADIGAHFLGVVERMPGLSEVTLVSQDATSVTIRTSEGVMTRSGIHKTITDDSVALQYDEVYQAGKMITTTAHFSDKFTASVDGVVCTTAISGLQAPGFVGFFYKTLGSRSIGRALLAANKAYLEGR